MTGPLLILGEHGQLALALAQAAAAHGAEPVLAGRSTADLAVRGAVSSLIERIRPAAVVNAAAYTDVDRAEREPGRAHAINAEGASEAAEAARRVGARFIHVSSDYVFAEDGPHDEQAAVGPVNAYGRTKYAGEVAVLNAHPEAAVVRASGVFSGRGKDFPSAIWRRAYTDETIRVVTDQSVSPILADDLAERLLALCAIPGEGVYHCPGAPGASWHSVAVEALRALSEAGGPDRTAEPVSSALFVRPAPRPSDSRLSGTRLEQETGLETPSWATGLRTAVRRWLALTDGGGLERT